jgi:hypothetical protein
MGLTRNVGERLTLAVDASRGVTFKVFATKRVLPDRSFVAGLVTFEGLAEEPVTLRKADVSAGQGRVMLQSHDARQMTIMLMQ